MTPLESLVSTGTKLWLDSVDPDLVVENKAFGATGATSNPIIISGLIKTGRFDDKLTELMEAGHDDSEVCWRVTDMLVKNAQGEFADVWKSSGGDTGWVSFELDPLLEDVDNDQSVEERADQYVELAKRWSEGHTNRMIKVPGTPGGIAALERIVANGATVNVTLLFSDEQYRAARDAVWAGAQKRDSLDGFKSVYSIFVSRIDVYTQKHAADLTDAAQGQVGIVNAKRIWKENNEFWADKGLGLNQEMIFASTGAKLEGDPADKYVSALAGSDIQTNPPGTNADVQAMKGKTFTKTVADMPPAEVLADIDAKVDFKHLETTLMEEGLAKFADPQKQLLALIAEKRAALQPAG